MAATILLVTKQQRQAIAMQVRAEMERQQLTNRAAGDKSKVAEKTISRLINAEGVSYQTLEKVGKGLGLKLGPLDKKVASQLDNIESGLSRVEEQVRLLRAEAAERDAEVLKQIAALRPPTRRPRRPRPQ